jgi:hypothetical protein
LLTAWRPRSVRAVATVLAAYAAGVALFAGSLLYSRYWFGTANVISHIGLAAFKYASVPRACDLFGSPLIGAVFAYPACFAFLPAATSRKNVWFLALVVLSVFAAAWLCTTTRNLNAGQVGAVRYAVWLLAPLWEVVFRWLPERLAWNGRTFRYALGAGLTMIAIVYFQLYRLPGKDIRRFGGAWRAVPEVAAIVRHVPYHGDIEVLVENIIGHEIEAAQFKHIYLWDLGRDRQVWVVAEAAARRLRQLEWSTPDAAAPHCRASPPQALAVSAADGSVALRLPADAAFHTHPVYGKYLILWTAGRIGTVRCNVPLVIRSTTVRQD